MAAGSMVVARDDMRLALGIGLNTAVYSVVDGVLWRSLPLPDSERLVVVGDGPELMRLQNRAEANILFHGHLPDEEVARLMSRARAFVLPGEEDFGISMVEALAAGAPVLAADSSAPAIAALKAAQGTATGLKPITAEATTRSR